MWPIGSYERFIRKIKGQENHREKVNYFGVLFCDVRQSKAKEYILNYLDVFHNRSGKFIDFYIPGYIPEGDNWCQENEGSISVGREKFLFNSNTYNDFCHHFESDFKVDIPFSSRLVLLEYKNGNFSTARKIVIELESSEEGTKNVGKLFLNIFKCAEEGKMGQTLDSISHHLSEKAKLGMVVAGGKSVLDFFGINIEPITVQYQEVRKFRIQ